MLFLTLNHVVNIKIKCNKLYLNFIDLLLFLLSILSIWLDFKALKIGPLVTPSSEAPISCYTIIYYQLYTIKSIIWYLIIII
jgi:hypothetical protein